jgi:HPt (histidine-containing phosphotransfer) domain-containing protein
VLLLTQLFKCLATLLLVLSGTGHAVSLQKGVADLREWDTNETPLLKLSGETEFYWEQFIVSEGVTAPPTMMDIPAGWNFSRPFPAHGYASYRIHVQLDQVRELRLLIQGIYTSARIFIDGRLVTTIGQLGKTPETSLGHLHGSWDYSFTPRDSSFDIVIEVSNFDIFLGGMMTPIYIGTQQGVRAHIQGLVAYGFFLIGSVFIMSFYHFGLFFLRRSDVSTLYYGLFCLCIGLYQLSGDTADTWGILLPTGLSIRVYVYNFSWILCLTTFLLYTKSLFPHDISPRVVQGITGLSLIYLTAIAFLDVRTYVGSTQTYQLVAAFMISYTIVVMVRAYRKKRDSIRIFFTSVLILFAMSVHDLIMLRGYYSHVPLAGLGVFIFTFCQSYLISARFSQAFRRAETSEAEVRQLASTLEVRVEEQTREIRSIMQSIELGIFAIHGPQQLIHKDYSSYLENILEMDQLEDQKALPLLFAQSNISDDQQHQVQSVVLATLGDSVLNFELNKDAFPRSMIRYSREGEVRNFELGWNPILNDADEVDKILVSVSDVTDLRKWEQEARHSAEELNMVAEVINIRESEFQRFIKSSLELLQQNLVILSKPDSQIPLKELTKIVLMNLHTVKGAARTLQFRGLADRIHQLEQATTDGVSLRGLVDEHEILLRHIQEYQRLAVEKLGRTAENQIRLVLPAHQAAHAYESLQDMREYSDHVPMQALDPLLTALQKQLYTTLPDLMLEILRNADSLARDLNKPKPLIDFKAPLLLVDSRVDEILRHIFFHLIRNSMDHGIETSEQRLAKGKSAAGTILLHVEECGAELVFRLQDDGQGLKLQKIGELAVTQGLLPPSRSLNPQLIVEQMFSLGISTASHITQISGRGLGMAAVARFIYESGGNIRIELLDSKPHRESYPFALIMGLPLHLFKRPAAGSSQAA